jgi:hypothetical protein
MAKRRGRKGGVNKTQAILDLLAAHPNGSPKEISAQLAQQGIKASPGYVSTIKSKSKRSKGKRRGRKPGAKASGDKISLSVLVDTKKFAAKMGGVGKLKAAIDALSKLE